MSDSIASTGHVWRFFRAGGFDQVRLDTGADLLALDQLDQKLWVALSCPTRGLEFDSKTLDLIDTDKDGRIRVPEVIGAVKWAAGLLKDSNALVKPSPKLPLAQINDSTPAGKQLLASAKQILTTLGKGTAAEITIEDTADTTKLFSQTRFNGDGIIPADCTEDVGVKQVIGEVIATQGSELDRSGKPGISKAKLDQFFADAQAYSDWWKKAETNPKSILPLGDATAAALAAYNAVRVKVDDYFARCRLAAFDHRALTALNRQESEYLALAAKDLSITAQEVSGFPLARIEAGKPLPLQTAVNPAWAAAIATLTSAAVNPLLGEKLILTEEEWLALKGILANYEAWLGSKAGASVEKLGLERVRAILAGKSKEAIEALIGQDKALEAEFDAIGSVERLIRYHRDLFPLVNNFVSFRDFYQRRGKAVFQVGTLYLDGRSCELCVRVDDQGKHGALATLSKTYLAYCECTRRGSAEKMLVAAAFTGGDSDFLMVGRNGVFYDRKGQDWDATIMKVIEHPISIRQAFWAPYKRISRMIGEQMEKFASSRDKAVTDRAAASVAETAAAAEKAKPGQPGAPAKPFDVAQFAGIFAAIGLALGAMGTAVAAVVTGFLELSFWQMPLALAGLILLISGPSMLLAWLKLRQRNLGPILDANGWAVNARAKINIPFGGALTGVAKLPLGASTSLDDPFEEKRQPWAFWFVMGIVLAFAILLWTKGYIRIP